MLGILVWVYLEDLTDAVVVVPLLKKLFFVCWRVTFDEVLQLRQIRCEEDATTHGEQ